MIRNKMSELEDSFETSRIGGNPLRTLLPLPCSVDCFTGCFTGRFAFSEDEDDAVPEDARSFQRDGSGTDSEGTDSEGSEPDGAAPFPGGAVAGLAGGAAEDDEP